MNKKLPHGYQARPARTEDIESIVEVFNADTEQLLGARLLAVDDLSTELGVPGFDIESDALVIIAPRGQVIAYQDAWDAEEPHVLADCWGRVHPEHVGCGIGAYLLDWAEQRARQGLGRAPEGARYVMRCSVPSLNQAAQNLYARAGLQLVRHSLRMVIDLNGRTPAPQWPDGVMVRTMLPHGEERSVYQAVRETFKDHWGYIDRPFEEDFQMWEHFTRGREDYDPSLWFLAMDGDQIAGFSLCRPETNDDPAMGWVATLGVRRPWRRRGLGRALLEHSFTEFSQRGKSRVGLGVDAQNLTGATRLYLKAGMQPDAARQSSIYEKELRPGIDLSYRPVSTD